MFKPGPPGQIVVGRSDTAINAGELGPPVRYLCTTFHHAPVIGLQLLDGTSGGDQLTLELDGRELWAQAQVLGGEGEKAGDR